MKYLSEYRDARLVLAVIEEIRRTGDAPLGADGDLRRPNALDRSARAGRAAAAGVELVHGPAARCA
jgi:hypothetical protein